VNAILLAAGYATRLYPLTQGRPKALLPIGGRPILDYIVGRLEVSPLIDRLVLVTNAKFAGHFREWAAERGCVKPLQIVDDGTTDNETRLGAVGDAQRAIEEAGLAGQGAFILGTDNLPRFDMLDVVALSTARGVNAVFAVPVADREKMKRMGVAELGPDGRIVSFEEKPEEPKGAYRVPPFYAYTARAVARIPAFLDEGNNPDAPGHFLEWLVKRDPVCAVRTDRDMWDIGTIETYRAACAEWDRQGPSSQADG